MRKTVLIISGLLASVLIYITVKEFIKAREVENNENDLVIEKKYSLKEIIQNL